MFELEFPVQAPADPEADRRADDQKKWQVVVRRTILAAERDPASIPRIIESLPKEQQAFAWSVAQARHGNSALTQASQGGEMREKGRARGQACASMTDAYVTLVNGHVRGAYGTGFILGLADAGLLQPLGDFVAGNVQARTQLLNAILTAIRERVLKPEIVASYGGSWQAKSGLNEQLVQQLARSANDVSAVVMGQRAIVGAHEETLQEQLYGDGVGAWLEDTKTEEYARRFRAQPKYQAALAKTAAAEAAHATSVQEGADLLAPFARQSGVPGGAASDQQLAWCLNLVSGSAYVRGLELLEAWKKAHPSPAAKQQEMVLRIEETALAQAFDKNFNPLVAGLRPEPGFAKKVVQIYKATVIAQLDSFESFQKAFRASRAAIDSIAEAKNPLEILNATLGAYKVSPRLEVGIVGRLSKAMRLSDTAAAAAFGNAAAFVKLGGTLQQAARALMDTGGNSALASKIVDGAFERPRHLDYFGRGDAAAGAATGTAPQGATARAAPSFAGASALGTVAQESSAAAKAVFLPLEKISWMTAAFTVLGVKDLLAKLNSPKEDAISTLEVVARLVIITSGFVAIGGANLLSAALLVQTAAAAWHKRSVKEKHRVNERELLDGAEGEQPLLPAEQRNLATSAMGSASATVGRDAGLLPSQMNELSNSHSWLFAHDRTGENMVQYLVDVQKLYVRAEWGGLQLASFYDFVTKADHAALRRLADMLADRHQPVMMPRYFATVLLACFAPRYWTTLPTSADVVRR